MAEIKYLKDVLGLQQVVLPPFSADLGAGRGAPVSGQNLPAKGAEGNLRLAFLAPEDLSLEELTLLGKMVESFSLAKGETKVLSDLEQLQQLPQDPSSLVVVNFLPDQSVQSHDFDHYKMWVNTFGPREILHNQNLKRETWATFKRVMECLKN